MNCTNDFGRGNSVTGGCGGDSIDFSCLCGCQVERFRRGNGRVECFVASAGLRIGAFGGIEQMGRVEGALCLLGWAENTGCDLLRCGGFSSSILGGNSGVICIGTREVARYARYEDSREGADGSGAFLEENCAGVTCVSHIIPSTVTG